MKTNLLLAILTCFLITACKDEKPVDCEMFHWSYEGDSGPERWADCSEDCGGQTQSPVNITGAINDPTLVSPSVNYEEVPFHVINNGHTIEFEHEPGSSLIFQGTQYELLQFHFHSESEHTVEGQQYPLELHLVHKHMVTGNLAVIGIFFTPGNENPLLQNFIQNLPDEEDEEFLSSEHFDADWLLPSNLAYYTYEGSLTTPPCSEIVTWIVMKTPVEISNAHLQQIIDILPDNNRPIQPLSGRQIREFD